MSKMPDPESAERFWVANSPPRDQGDSPSLRWTRPLLEESTHNALDLAPHPFRYPEYRHEINGNGRQYGLQENQTTIAGKKPSLPSSKAGLNLRMYWLPVTITEYSLRQREPEVSDGE